MKIDPKIYLQDLLAGMAENVMNCPVSGLSLDSRNTKPGDVFFAVSGTNLHGIFHAREAIDRGAVAIVYEPEGITGKQISVLKGNPLIEVKDLKNKLGKIASRFYGEPTSHINVIGITGTNGKTSCSQFLAQALPGSGIIGTLGWGVWEHLNSTINTTPDALTLQAIMAEFVSSKKQTVSMEVSSHGIEQGRINGIEFKGALFTNISRDHLDYHGSMDAYVEAKISLLKSPGLEFAVVNLDSEYIEKIIAAVPEEIELWGFSLAGNKTARGNTVSASHIYNGASGIEFDISWEGKQETVNVPVYGDFNIENSLAVLTVLLAMGLSLPEVVKRMGEIRAIEGRMEHFRSGAKSPNVFVDYAHTPDALENVLTGLRRHCEKNLWVVFGCGGERDRGKRSQMGGIAEELADHVIVTDDNPRSENADQIIEDILSGCQSSKIEVIRDRQQAIQTAINHAGIDDVVLIAGKGHETWQEVNGEKRYFSDRKIVKESLLMRGDQR